jgi:hypothetical protein
MDDINLERLGAEDAAYALMCFKSVEIQAMHASPHSQMEEGDRFLFGSGAVRCYSSEFSKGRGSDFDRGRIDVWLPRADQLWGMAFKSSDGVRNKLRDVFGYMDYQRAEGHEVSEESLEVVLLQYVMNLVHSKRWDASAKEWVLIGEIGRRA